jgi:hypothetical protein
MFILIQNCKSVVIIVACSPFVAGRRTQDKLVKHREQEKRDRGTKNKLSLSVKPKRGSTFVIFNGPERDKRVKIHTEYLLSSGVEMSSIS